MSIFDWFADRQKKKKRTRIEKSRNPQNSCSKCPKCSIICNSKDLIDNFNVCPNCNHHYRIDSESLIRILADENSFESLYDNLIPVDPLVFRDHHSYANKLKEIETITRLTEAVTTGICHLEGLPLALGVMDFGFMGGSMGSVVGEKITRIIETATILRYPLVIVCASGGARMQEGMLSLVQMAKISGALSQYRDAHQLYISLLTHPTMGGITASCAMLGDIILAEPEALIGFAGRRVIKQTLRENLPDNFQTSEYLQEHGFIDHIVQRTILKSTLANLLRFHGY